MNIIYYMLSYVRKASLYEQAAFNFKGSFSQNLTASLYVSAEGGVVGRPRPRNKSHVGKIPMGPPLPVEKTRPTGQGGILAGDQKVGAVILPQGCERGVRSRTSADVNRGGNR